MRPEGAFVRTLQRTEDVILGRGVNVFGIGVRVRVIRGLCDQMGTRTARNRPLNRKNAKCAETRIMRPEGAFMRALQRTEEVILGRGVNLFDMCIRVRVL
jgi:hypothetical protein